MGEAKKRGTFEQRRTEAVKRQSGINKIKKSKPANKFASLTVAILGVISGLFK